MPLVTIRPSSGMGNQMFQIAALLGYAERYGHTPVFLEEPGPSDQHPITSFRARSWVPFPLTNEKEWIRVPLDCFTYRTPPYHAGNVLLEGYAQCEAYGPSKLPPLCTSLSPSLIPLPWHTFFFLHVRRGDYLHPLNQHHAVDLQGYYRTCLRKMDPSWTCFVVSDDIEWCRKHLPSLDLQRKWVWCPTITDVETMVWMSLCEQGGICANSTFSWWGAKLGWNARKKGLYCMPGTWGYGPAFSNTYDLYPSWATVVPC